MKIFLKVKTNAKLAAVEDLGHNQFAVAVAAPPKQGKANAAVLRAMADYLNIPVSRLSLVGGLKAKQKIVEIV